MNAHLDLLRRVLHSTRDGVAALYYGAVKRRDYEARYQGDGRDRLIRADALKSARAALSWARQPEATR